MSLSADPPLCILAFDHRTSFAGGLFGIRGEPSAVEKHRMGQAKQLILSGLLQARDERPNALTAVLVDEQYGAGAARRATASGVSLAMCAEKSSQVEFCLEYGEQFDRHIEAFALDFVKVLVRFNPEGDEALNRRQLARLAGLSAWLSERVPKLLLELIVPPERHQLARLCGGNDGYTRDLRPELTARSIRQFHEAGVEPDVWKVEGLETTADCELVAAAARAGGRTNVTCIVLGAGATEDKVVQWLAQAAAADGFHGFAVGRTIWWSALERWRQRAIDEETVVATVAANYTRLIDEYQAAAQRPAAIDPSHPGPDAHQASRTADPPA